MQETVEHAALGQCAHDRGPQLRQFCDRRTGVASPDVREGFGEIVDLPGGEAQRRPDITDGVTHLVRVAHAHAGTAMGAEAIHDAPVDVRAACRLHIDIDVGQNPA